MGVVYSYGIIQIFENGTNYLLIFLKFLFQNLVCLFSGMSPAWHVLWAPLKGAGSIFPKLHIAIQIRLTIIFSIASYERSFSKLKLSYSRASIGLVGRVFANGPGDLGSIAGRVIPKSLKMVLDTSLLNTQQYKVRIEGKVEQSRERSSTLPYTLV